MTAILNRKSSAGSVTSVALKVVNDLDNILLYDTFDRADGAVGTSESGATYVESGSDAWGITSSRVRRQGFTGPSALLSDVGHGDVFVSVAVEVGLNSVESGIALRADDHANGLFALVINSGAGGIRLYKHVAGVSTQLAVFTINNLNSGSDIIWLGASVAEDVVTVHNLGEGTVLGTHALTGGDETTFPATKTSHGLWGGGIAAVRISDFRNLAIRRVR